MKKEKVYPLLIRLTKEQKKFLLKYAKYHDISLAATMRTLVDSLVDCGEDLMKDTKLD